MLFANTAKELEDQINLVPSQYKVYTKGQSEEFYNARGEWIYDKTLHDNYIDHDMLARGISSRFFPQTDPQKIANSWLQDHLTKDNALSTQMIVAKYEKEIKELAESEETRGLTIIPLALYNKGRVIKISIAIVRGKKKGDKRESIKKREASRDIAREMKGRG